MVARVLDHAIRMRIEMLELEKGCAPQAPVLVWVSRITHQKMVDMRIAAWVHGSNSGASREGSKPYTLPASPHYGHALKSTLSLSRINASGFQMQGFIGTHIVEIRLGLYRSDSMRKDFNWMRA
jgi:hypothetical protein